MTIRGFFLFACLMLPIASMADNSCRGVDLRRPDLNRPQTQEFINSDGKETDSGLCASFSSALLTSQQLGISINPVDYAFKGGVARLSHSDNDLAFCRQAAVDAYLGKKQTSFIQSYSDFVHQVNGKLDASTSIGDMSASDLQKIGQWLDGVCGQRIQSPSLDFTTKDLNPNDPSATAPAMGDQIDQLLDTGHFISYTYSFVQTNRCVSSDGQRISLRSDSRANGRSYSMLSFSDRSQSRFKGHSQHLFELGCRSENHEKCYGCEQLLYWRICCRAD
jgi:hypothetical protein